MAKPVSALALDVKTPIESPGSAGIFTADVLSNIIVRQDSPHQRLRVQICAGNGHKILLTDYERPVRLAPLAPPSIVGSKHFLSCDISLMYRTCQLVLSNT